MTKKSIILALTILATYADAQSLDGVVVDVDIAGEELFDVQSCNDRDEVTVRLEPRPGLELRVRAPFVLDEWTSEPVEIVLPVPDTSSIDELVVETRASRAKSPTIASSGYIRVKKLNSGG
jgi:hypothetical protein